MEPTTKAEQILERLKIGTKAKTDTELGHMLGVSQQAIYNARQKEKVPVSWSHRAAERFGLDIHWILFGEREMQRPLISAEEQAAYLAKVQANLAAVGMELDPKILQDISREPDIQPRVGNFAPPVTQNPPLNNDLMAEILRLNQELRELRADNQKLRTELLTTKNELATAQKENATMKVALENK